MKRTDEHAACMSCFTELQTTTLPTDVHQSIPHPSEAQQMIFNSSSKPTKVAKEHPETPCHPAPSQRNTRLHRSSPFSGPPPRAVRAQVRPRGPRGRRGPARAAGEERRGGPERGATRAEGTGWKGGEVEKGGEVTGFG